MDVLKRIKSKCTELENEYGFTILFAIESGSRLWGMSSKYSDFDVHLVFYYPVKRYLSIQKPTQKHYDIFDFTINQIITKK